MLSSLVWSVLFDAESHRNAAYFGFGTAPAR